MADDLRADLDQLLPQRRQRPLLHGIGQRQGAHEVAEVIGQCMQLEPDGIVVELAAGQAGPLDGVLAFLDPLLGGAALIVERNHPLGRTAQVPEALGAPETLLADSGYFSEANVNACAEAEIAPLITPGRERHHLSWKDRFAGAPPPPENPTPLEAMTHRLATPEGRQLYALRKQTPEPVFGIIKSAMGFRQFSLRGLDKVTGEWNLVTLAWNIKRMFTLQYA